ncbi:MAG: amidase [Betaproteobacteria bacterium RIFCSPLOWO2_12_FULL_67_28]|nr:MAG: amidase [Betaproteobacteria bacterium RIFCSPLOWO2_12_FULL_67_28]
MSELHFTGARRLARLIRTRKLSAVEAMRAFIARIERVNPKVNAIVTFVPEQALAAAKKLDRRLARKDGAAGIGPLAGLPIAYKDMVPTKGIRTTFGSPIYAEHLPGEDHALVERLSAAGAITLGKTNTPEFAAGSQTFNPIFGATLNPYDTTRTCGGSSGGAAVAVACGMLPFADGSDLGASLRNPGNFCNVVGFRPTPGRVPSYPSNDSWASLSVMGPLARTVEDAALLLSAMAGPDPRAPTSIAEPGKGFARPLERSFRKARLAWSRNLGGLPVDPRITRVLEARRKTFESLGCIVEDAEPDLAGADEAFQTLRALLFVQKYGELLKTHRDQIKDTVVWNIEEGLKLDGPRIARALNLRSQVFHAMRTFLERYDYLLLPVNQVLPFPVAEPYPTEINGVRLANYIEWMKTCYAITVTSHPAISVPAGFAENGLPVGLQIVGRYRDDFGVLQLAHAFEQATQCWKRRPPLA